MSLLPPTWLNSLHGGDGYVLLNVYPSMRRMSRSVYQKTTNVTVSPTNVGVLLLRLLMETKSSADKQADVVLASTFASGLSPLYWFQEVLRQRRLLNIQGGKLFVHRDGTAWTSTYFKMTHLYPALRIQQLNGDAAFKFFDETPGNTLEEKLYSFHTYRRGGRTHVSKKRPGCVRAATATETAEHGRWRVKFSGGEDMPTHYRESTIEDRAYITLMCM